LAKCHATLGTEGAALIYEMLMHNMTAREIAEARCRCGPNWEMYYARRFFLALASLAEVMGFAGR
jgi:hypothetical protein